jgi:hypothetical protein
MIQSENKRYVESMPAAAGKRLQYLCWLASARALLYHMLLSAGNFAVYRAEYNVFNLLVPRFRGMRSSADRKGLLDVWLRSKLFRVSGFDAGDIGARIMKDWRSGGDFLRILMQEIARQQAVARWADCTPEHLLFMEQIKREIPTRFSSTLFVMGAMLRFPTQSKDGLVRFPGIDRIASELRDRIGCGWWTKGASRKDV